MRLRSLSAIPAAALVLAALAPTAGVAQATPPTTTFEDTGGASWTPHDDELAFLEAVAAQSPRVEVDVIGETEATGRPLHLVRIGHPTPPSMEQAQAMPVELHICTQHGNEPAGREACLIKLRDLAFTDDAALIEQMTNQVILFVPTANPDGREANSRENALGVDLNRNHLEVQQWEVRAIGRVVRDWQPVINMDHHEYGPIIPGLYDDDLLYLWARNLNVHKPLRDLSHDFAVNHLDPCVFAKGYRADEYGLLSVGGQPAPDLDLQQSAGDWDDGISRNAAALRHGMGILIESSFHDAGVLDSAEVGVLRERRVDSHLAAIDCTLEWMAEHAPEAYQVSRESMLAKSVEGAARNVPLYFDGQDEDTTVDGSGNAEPTSFADPPPCGYLVDADDAEFEFPEAAEVHGLQTAEQDNGDVFVTMAQFAEPVVGLLLDGRAKRHLVEGEPLDDCSPYESVATTTVVATGTVTGGSGTGLPLQAGAPLPTTGGGLALLGLAALGLVGALRRRG